MCFQAKSRGYSPFLVFKNLDFLCLDPSIWIKIAILTHFFLLIARKNTFSKNSNKLRKTIISPLNYEKKWLFVRFLIQIFAFFRKKLQFCVKKLISREQIAFYFEFKSLPNSYFVFICGLDRKIKKCNTGTEKFSN